MHIFGKLAQIFGKLVHIFAQKLVSRTSKQVLRNLGPLWQPGGNNDTNACSEEPLGAVFFPLRACRHCRQLTGHLTGARTGNKLVGTNLW